MNTTENTRSIKDLALSEARKRQNRFRKVFVLWTAVCAGKRRTITEGLVDLETLASNLADSTGRHNDWLLENVEEKRLNRTGVEWTDGSLPVGAEDTIGDWINAYNGGDDAISIFEVPEFSELLEQFTSEKFNKNTLPTAEQVSEILCDLWKAEDKTLLEGETVSGALHEWNLRDELPEGKEWKKKFLKEVGFDQFREPKHIHLGGNGNVVWFLNKTDKEISNLFETLRECADEEKEEQE